MYHIAIITLCRAFYEGAFDQQHGASIQGDGMVFVPYRGTQLYKVIWPFAGFGASGSRNPCACISQVAISGVT